MIKKYSFLIVIIITAVLFASCEKEININLNDSAKRYVIEGTVTNKAGGCIVKLSQTKNFDADNSFAGVSGALVAISSNGNIIPLRETSPGIYTNDTLQGSTGSNYSMQLSINGEVFTASCTMPQMVRMDSLYIQNEDVFGTTARLPTVLYLDPATDANFYRFVVKRNGNKVKQTFVWNDEWSNGNINTTNLFVQPENDDDKGVEVGDSINVEMMSITKDVYKYFFSLGSSTGESNSASPANPISNITGGALGYFSAHTTQEKMVIAP